MSLPQRALLSATCLAVASVLSRMYMSAVPEAERAVLRIMEECERARLLAGQGRQARAQHLGACLGLCTAAHILLDEVRIEEVTGIHLPSYRDRLTRDLSALAEARQSDGSQRRRLPKKEA